MVMQRRFIASEQRRPNHVHILLVTTGSVASIKAPLIVRELMKVRFRMRMDQQEALTDGSPQYENVEVQVVATKASLTFFQREDIEILGRHVWTDDDEWDPNYKIGDPILHIELRRWADIVLVAPCSANTLAKIAQGVCDNVVTSLMRALSPTTPTYIFPAMNTLMYEHPLTAEHLHVVKEVIKYNVVGRSGRLWLVEISGRTTHEMREAEADLVPPGEAPPFPRPRLCDGVPLDDGLSLPLGPWAVENEASAAEGGPGALHQVPTPGLPGTSEGRVYDAGSTGEFYLVRNGSMVPSYAFCLLLVEPITPPLLQHEFWTEDTLSPIKRALRVAMRRPIIHALCTVAMAICRRTPEDRGRLRSAFRCPFYSLLLPPNTRRNHAPKSLARDRHLWESLCRDTVSGRGLRLLYTPFPIYIHLLPIFNRISERLHTPAGYCDYTMDESVVFYDGTQENGEVEEQELLASSRSSPRTPVTRTVAIIKHHALEHRFEIERRIQEAGFEIVKERQMEFDTETDPETLEELFGEDTHSLSEGPVWVYILERRRAVEVWHSLMGPRNPDHAREDHPDSLRALYGISEFQNGLMGAPDLEIAEVQIAALFASSPPFPVSDLPPEDGANQYDAVHAEIMESLARTHLDEGYAPSSVNGSSTKHTPNGKPTFRARPIPASIAKPDIVPRMTKAASPTDWSTRRKNALVPEAACLQGALGADVCKRARA
ncbi:hypothetical protein NMY22_g10694 [Coprinellus aureogranulatus]|nr:hypothetical protein NMY22_g10694 [Coprinellus aureogranulatus]